MNRDPIPVLAVIPARIGSTRLPEKPLADIRGRPMIQWVYERARAARGIDRVVVATDHERIFEVVKKFGGEVEMTSPECQSGTDRVAEVAEKIPSQWVVNLQGDEPLLVKEAIEGSLQMVREKGFEIGTASLAFKEVQKIREPSLVKVLADRHGRAIYFSRHPIPYSRGTAPVQVDRLACRLHLGIYVFKREVLKQFRSLPVSDWERGEMLEQLRALEQGISIGVHQIECSHEIFGIDTPEDLERARAILSDGRPEKRNEHG